MAVMMELLILANRFPQWRNHLLSAEKTEKLWDLDDVLQKMLNGIGENCNTSVAIRIAKMYLFIRSKTVD